MVGPVRRVWREDRILLVGLAIALLSLWVGGWVKLVAWKEEVESA